MTFRFMLDANIVSDIVRNPEGSAARRTRQAAGAVCVSVVVASELRYGCARKGSLQLTRRVEAILSTLPVVPFDAPADRYYAAIRAGLESSGRSIGMNDFWIAAHAAALSATLVTANTREFERVPGLALENWLAQP